MRWVAVTIYLALVALCFTPRYGHAQIPPAAVPYERTLVREAHQVWGLKAPIAVLAGQIEQESAWRPAAASPYAEGLAQFTPATARWISGAYPALAADQPWNPDWALRALATYDRKLYNAVDWFTPDCDHWAFALAAYNGGAGWLPRDRSLCLARGGCDAALWWGNVERYTARSAAAARENRAYPRQILQVNQWRYKVLGGTVSCFTSASSSAP